jgi:S-adenosylmethionine:tRNA ribosyltransferase-isomerase
MVLVSTFASRELIRRAYEEAIRERYRLLSYGDAMLIQ